MSKKLSFFSLLSCLMLLNLTVAWGQNRCGTTDYMEQMLQDPDYRAQHEQVQEQIQQKIAENSSQSFARSSAACPDVTVLPIAIHYQGVSGGVTNQACLIQLAQEQIAILNADYTATNPDITNWDAVSSNYPGVQVGDACIEFRLATQNHPAGSNLSDGELAITYNATTGSNSSTWSGYLNIFVQDAGGVLGFSPKPGFGNGDGVTIDFCAFGASGLGCGGVGPDSGCGAGWAYTGGRTLTHEVGHYLNLDHIWGDGGCGVDDGISDTPEAGTEYFGCPAIGTGTTSCGSQDMFMNYMDYVNDDCMFMFSEEQASVMNSRADLLANFVLVDAAEVAPAAPVANFSISGTNVCEGSVVSFTDISTGSPTTWAWTFSGAGVSPASSSEQNPNISVTSAGTLDVTLTASNTEGGDTYSESFTMTLLASGDPACGFVGCAVDGDNADGGFESDAGATWTVQTDNIFGTPHCTTTGCGANQQTGVGFMWLGGYSADQFPVEGYTASFGQSVNIPASTGSLVLEFGGLIVCTGAASDNFTVSIDGNLVYSFDNGTNQDGLCDAAGYATVTVPLDNAYADGGNHDLLFETTMGTDVASNFIFDDVTLCILPACAPTVDFALADCDPAGSDNFDVVVTMTEFGTGTGSTSFTLTATGSAAFTPITLTADEWALGVPVTFANAETVTLTLANDNDPLNCSDTSSELTNFCELCEANPGTFTVNTIEVCPGEDLILTSNNDFTLSNFPDATSPGLAYFIYNSEPISGDPFGAEFGGTVFTGDLAGNVTVPNDGSSTGTLWLALGTLATTADGLTTGACFNVDLANVVAVQLLVAGQGNCEDGPCTAYTDGPYTDLSPAPCVDNCGTPTEAGFQIFSNEAYAVENVTAGATYVVDICNGYGAWVAEITVVDETSGDVIATTFDTTDGSECNLEFTTPNDGNILIIFTEAGNCAGAQQLDNGFVTLDCVSGAGPCPLPTCDDGIQNQDETGIDCGGATCAACICGAGSITSSDQIICPGAGINLTVTGEDLTLGAGDYVYGWGFYDPTTLDLISFVTFGSDPAGYNIVNIDYNAILTDSGLDAIPNGAYLVSGIAYSENGTPDDTADDEVCFTANDILVTFVDGADPACSGPCTSYADGPYVDLGEAPCATNCGTPTEAGFQVYSSEAYAVTNVAAGGTYLVSICDGYGAWVAEITVVDAVTNDVIASTEGTTNGSECSLEFTTPNAGDILIIINDANSCGGASNLTDNGFLTLDCVSGAGPCTCQAGNATSAATQTVCPGEGITLTVENEDLTLGTGDFNFNWLFYQDDGTGTDTLVSLVNFGNDPTNYNLVNIDYNAFLAFNELPTIAPGTYTVFGLAYSVNGTPDDTDDDVLCFTDDGLVGTEVIFLAAGDPACPVCSVLDDTQAVTETAICSGGSLTLTDGVVIDNTFTGGTVTWVYGTTETFDAYTEGMPYMAGALTATGCDAMTYYVKARLDGIAECTDQSDAFMVMVYPAINATAVDGTCEAGVTLNDGCAYDITWNDGTTTGTGASYTLTPALEPQVGMVTFTITNAAAPAGCNSLDVVANYNCVGLNCAVLDDTQAVAESAICSGGSLTLNSGMITDNDFAGGSVTWVYGTTETFDAYTEGMMYADGALTAMGCDAMTYYVKARLDGVAECMDMSDAFMVMVYPEISATAVDGACEASVMVAGDCAYDIAWNNGTETGMGATYTLEQSLEAQMGMVTFTVTNAAAPAGCNSVEVTANYNCAALVCATLDGNQSLTTEVCPDVMIVTDNGTITDNDFAGGSVTWVYSMSETFDAYTEGTVWNGEILTATGCDAMTYYFVARLDGVDGCTDQSAAMTVNVYPEIMATTSSDNCMASIDINGCDYSVTWNDGTNSGANSTYTVMPTLEEQSGTVMFTVTNAAAPAFCNTLEVEVPYTCAALVCSALSDVSVTEMAVCSNGSVMTSASVTDNDFTGGSATWVYSMSETFDAYAEGEVFNGNLPANTTCDAMTYYLVARLDGVDGCFDQSEAMAVMVYPNIEATTTNSVECSDASIELACDFATSWEDADGNTGNGTTYTPALNTIGAVTFTVTNADAPEGCNAATFTATYNCTEDVCSTLDGTQSVAESAICSGQTLSFTEGDVTDNDFTGGFVTWVYGTSETFDAYAGTTFTGDLPANTGCEAMTYYVKARLDGLDVCFDQSEAMAVMVYPNIEATGFDGECEVGLGVNCTNFSVTWETNTGQTGVGAVYIAATGESGMVTFMVENTDAPEGCNMATAMANFDCPDVVCSTLDGNQSVENAMTCTGDVVSVNDGGVNDFSFSGGSVTWLYSDNEGFDAYTEGTLFVGNLPENSGCEAMTYYLKARLDGVAECTDQSEAMAVMVYPNIETTINSEDCMTTVTSNCDFAIMWEDANGTGEGGVYEAAEGTAGEVTFMVTNADAPEGCQSVTLTANYDCPEVCTLNEAGICNLTVITPPAFTATCAPNGFQASATDFSINDSNYELGYVLSSSSSLPDENATVLMYSTDGVFFNEGLEFGTTYYVYSAALLAPFGSLHNDECSDYSDEPQEIAFYQEMAISEVMAMCADDNMTYTVTFNVSGGNGEYMVEGGSVTDGVFTSDPISSSEPNYTFNVMDSNGCAALAAGAQVCTEENFPPTAENDEFTIVSNSGDFMIMLTDYANDVNGDDLTYSIGELSSADGGTIMLNADNSVTYSPATDFVGTVTFMFTVSDGEFEATGMMTINVTEANTPPTVENGNFEIVANSGAFTVDLSAYTSDIDGDDLIITIGEANPTESGTVMYDAETSTLTFMPAEGFAGIATIEFTVSDGEFEATGTIEITVTEEQITCEDLAPITIFADYDFSNLSGETILEFALGGGLPSTDGSTYNVTLTLDDMVVYEGTVDATGVLMTEALMLDLDVVYTVNVTDDLGCGATSDLVVAETVNIELLNFSGQILDEGNLLKWITASETNNAFFTLSRSSNGGDFVEIAQILGSGNTTTARQYESLDKDAVAGVSVYRLTQTDFDGTTTLAGTVSLVRGETTLGFVNVAPIPANDFVNITFVSPKAEAVKIGLYDVAGKLISLENVDAVKGNNLFTFDLTNVASGVYFISMENNNGQNISTKLIKE
ncbi:MAG: Ig-like domain-containing protein [Chitinophagales bacterium]